MTDYSRERPHTERVGKSSRPDTTQTQEFGPSDLVALRRFELKKHDNGVIWTAIFDRVDVRKMNSAAGLAALQSDSAGRILRFIREAGIKMTSRETDSYVSQVYSIKQRCSDGSELPGISTLVLTDEDFKSVLRKNKLELYGDSIREPDRPGFGRR